MEWIKVSDRLPPQGKPVFFMVDDNYGYGYCIVELWYHMQNKGDMDPIVMPTVTHWMIPEPPIE